MPTSSKTQEAMSAPKIEGKKQQQEQEGDVVSTNEPISMLLCKETLPGSPSSSGIKEAPDTGTRKVYADSGFLVTASLAARDDMDSEYGGKKSHGRETAENSSMTTYLYINYTDNVLMLNAIFFTTFYYVWWQ